MKPRHVTGLAAVLMSSVSSLPAMAQQSTLPPVEVQQQQQKKAAAAKAKVAKKPPAQQQAPAVEQPAPEPGEEVEPVLDNSPFGASQSGPAAARAQTTTTSPVTPSTILPGDLQNFSSAGTRIDTEQLDKQRPLTNHEALARVPGIVTTNDDGMARHSGIGIRGAPFRRSRKTLVMEDGVSINQTSYIDPSTHYTPPTDRVESIEVMRGTVISHGPLNNHGVVNFRNLSPFGANETVIKGAIGYTEGSDKDINNSRHVHTRQTIGNVGVVASYSGAEGAGAWANEVLRYNDFYGALGFKGSDQDLTISGGYFRQRDRYDELNYTGVAGADVKAGFIANGRFKGAGFPASDEATDGFEFSSYNANYFRLMLSHNWYINSNTTLSTKLFGTDLDRARFFSEDAGPANGDPMQGRDRQYKTYGADSRIEVANLPLLGSIKHDLMAGIHYEQQYFRDARTEGPDGVVLDMNSRGDVTRLQRYEADAFSAFIQTSVHVTKSLTVTPGVRFENYDLTRESVVDTDNPPPDVRATGAQDFNHVLPGVSVAWEALPQTTLYGGYHRGLTPSVARGDVFPLGEEIGDNFQVGIRSTVIRGLTFDVAYFHSDISDYQIKEPFTVGGANVFGGVDEVDIDGVEVYSRLDSKPFTGGRLNWFGEAVYTFTDTEIVKSAVAAEVGNRLPESLRHFANLTVGVEHDSGWDASVTYTYRGGFYTDTANTYAWTQDNPAAPETLTGGYIDDVWLLSARGNMKVTNTLSLFVSGQNLTDEFYASDLSDGAKPGQGRTIMGGFTLKFD